jgi:hypothetical protein
MRTRLVTVGSRAGVDADAVAVREGRRARGGSGFGICWREEVSVRFVDDEGDVGGFA